MAATTHENYDTLLTHYLGLHDTQALLPSDKGILIGSLLAEGEFTYVPRRDNAQLRWLHRQFLASPTFPRTLSVLDNFIKFYHSYAPPSGEFADSRVAEASSHLVLLGPDDRRELEERTAPLLIDAAFSDSGVRSILEDPPLTAYKQAEITLSVESVEIPLEEGSILELGTGVREVMRRVQELHYGVFSRVVQIGPHSFPSYVARHLLQRASNLSYERIAKDIAQGTDELVERQAQNSQPGFSAVVMAQSTEVSSLDQTLRAIRSARELCREGGMFVLRDAPSNLYKGSHTFYDLVDVARKHFGSPIDQKTLIQRRNIDDPVDLAVFRAS